MLLNRRTFAIAAAASLAPGPLFAASASNTMLVFRDPGCGCCGAWVDHVRKAGFVAEVREVEDVAPYKQKFGVPEKLTSCHTAQIDGYVIEGHVPADAIKRLLTERPKATGLAVAGMPAGSPGMEGGTPQAFDVILFGPGTETPFARYIGPKQL